MAGRFEFGSRRRRRFLDSGGGGGGGGCWVLVFIFFFFFSWLPEKIKSLGSVCIWFVEDYASGRGGGTWLRSSC